MTFRRLVYLLMGAGVFAAVAVGSYALVREARGDSTARLAVAQLAQPTPPPTPSGGTPKNPNTTQSTPPPTPTPAPPGGLPRNPDTTKPWWYQPYLEEERTKARYDQTINGITVGPTAKHVTEPVCVPGSTQEAALDRAAGSPVMIAPKYLPVGTVAGVASAMICPGSSGTSVAIAAYRAYSITPDPASGRRGGVIHISRWRGEPSASVPIPAERWFAGTISGHPAAIAGPQLPIGFGESAVVVHANGVVTMVQSSGLTLDEIRRVAEGLY